MVDVNTIAIVSRNTYSFDNSTIFYSLINETFLPYYQQTIRKAQEWLDGYDPSFHKDDMVSTRISAKLMNGFANSIFGRGLIFSKGKMTTSTDALDYISHKWCDESNFQNAVKQLIGVTLPLGTGALKLNRSSDGKLWVEALRIDNFFFSVDGRKKLQKFTCFIRNYQSIDNREENYFLVEKRYFKTIRKPFEHTIDGKKYQFSINDVVPIIKYDVHKYTGTINNNTMPTSIRGEGINYKTLPDYVKKGINEDYSAIRVGEEIPLPFKNYLGVELFFNEGGDITNPTLPFGRALNFDCIADFMEYDMEKSYSIRDLYNSKGIVGVPKALSQSQVVVGTGGNMTHNSPYGQLNIPGYELVNGLDPQSQKPIVTQFEMRASEHELKQMAILKSIAIAVGVSPRSIASFLVQEGEKTDDQIQSEDDTITQWIKGHRQDYLSGLNRIVACVLNYQGYTDNVEVRFANDGLMKGDKQLENIQKRMELNMLTLEDAIREYYPDLDEIQLDEKIEKLLMQQQEQQNQAKEQMLNSFGELEDNEQDLL